MRRSRVKHPVPGEPQVVTPHRREVFNAVELLVERQGQLVMPHRGDLTLLQLINQVYDGVNVVALDLYMDDTELKDIRSPTAATQRRIKGLLRGKAAGTGEEKVYWMRIRIVAVIG